MLTPGFRLQGFFRRSIQQNIQYKKCLKNETCTIIRINRNRCQQCRFKKCLSVGMSRDGEFCVSVSRQPRVTPWRRMMSPSFVSFVAVRFGRIPKREKQRMLAEMQSAMNNVVNNQAVGLTSPSFPGQAVAPQPSPAQTMAPPPSPLPALPNQSPRPPPPAASPPLCPSPSVEHTISIVARAHRETFVYAYDKLGKGLHFRNGGELNIYEANCCPSGYHLNSRNSIFHHDNNVSTYNSTPEHGLAHQNNGYRLCLSNTNMFGSHCGPGVNVAPQDRNCPWKERKEILLVSMPANL